MNLLTSTPKRETIARVQFLPAVSIIVPFAPVITPKKTLECSLKNIMGRVEAILTAGYTLEKAIPVIIKLRNLIASLNYNTHKKSLAIFASPITENVYYLDAEMEEKIVIDPAFKFSELVFYKKEKQEYLILLLGDNYSKMFLGEGTHIKLIKSNTLAESQFNENTLTNTKSYFSNTTKENVCIKEKFLLQMDTGLSIILKSYPLPVFVIGDEKVFKDFKAITVNDENLVEFIHGTCVETPESEMEEFIKYILSFWKRLKQRHLINQIEKAGTQNKLRTGIPEIFSASIQSKGKLLVVEKQMLRNIHAKKGNNFLFKTSSGINEVFFIRDEADDMIKNLLENGTNIELIDDGQLEKYGNVALIENGNINHKLTWPYKNTNNKIESFVLGLNAKIS